MDVKFGISPISWTNDDLPELGGDTPLETCLQEASEIGFDGVELGGKFPRTPPELAGVLKPHELTLISGWFSGLLFDHGSVENELVRITPHVNLLVNMGCKVLVYCDVSQSIQGEIDVTINASPSMADDEYAAYGQKINQVAEFVEGAGLKFAYHHHMGTLIETAEELDKFMAATDELVGLTFDTGHAAMAGMDVAAVVRQYSDRIVHFHCKDIRPEIVADVRKEDRSFLQGVLDGMFTVPGDGGLDFNAILGELGRAKYSGWLVIEAEQDPAKANPKEYAQLGLRHIKSIVEPQSSEFTGAL